MIVSSLFMKSNGRTRTQGCVEWYLIPHTFAEQNLPGHLRCARSISTTCGAKRNATDVSAQKNLRVFFVDHSHDDDGISPRMRLVVQADAVKSC